MDIDRLKMRHCGKTGFGDEDEGDEEEEDVDAKWTENLKLEKMATKT